MSKKNTSSVQPSGPLKQLWKFTAPYTRMRFATIILSLCATGLQIVPALFVGFIAQDLYMGETHQLMTYGIALLAISLLSMLCLSGSTFISHLIAAEVMSDVRAIISDKLYRIPLGFFMETDSNQIKKMLLDDVEQLEDGIAHIIPEMIAAVFTPLITFILMLFLNIPLAIAAFLPTFMAVSLFIYIQIKTSEIAQRFYAAQGQISSTLFEVITAIPVVKMFKNGNAILVRAEKSFNGLIEIVGEWSNKVQAKSGWFFVLSSMNLLFVLPLAGGLLLAGKIAIFEFTFFIIASLIFSNIASSMFEVMTRIQQQSGVVSRYHWLMSQAELTYPKIGQTPEKFNIELSHITFCYENSHQEALKNISLNIPQGSSIALVGSSGSGKSTIANLICRLWEPTQGDISVGDISITQIDEPTFRQMVSFVSQKIFIFKDTIINNIRIAKPTATIEEVEFAAKLAQAHQFIMRLPQGYHTVLNNERSLSVGEKQRIAIAAAILKNAPILVLDEATAYADPECEYELQLAMKALCVNKTVIVIAHRLSTICHLDNIVVLEEGCIIEQGTHQQLLDKKGTYARQWQAWQQDAYQEEKNG
ncbi:ABC transporter ATP-binding protein [Providencia sneebia]|uniref:Inner membrane ABC-transporter n=1 Tax=Providencia sneebia DSM 19967 TaxID=1141660 RepID=K8WHX5_9GAMM|nr:inner membrane ABC-transporter [Providencia sneebia DSM 19967]